MNAEKILELQQTYADKGYAVIDSNLEHNVLDSAVAELESHFHDKNTATLVPYADAGRIQDGWYISDNVMAIAKAPAVLSALKHLYGVEADPFQTLNFPTGTQQHVHSDSIHFNSEPFGMMCGVWVALEDIGPDQGPLIYYPGSHKLPEMNFEDFGLPANYDFYGQYLDGLQNLIKEHNFQPEYGLIKKGQALIWSANLLHGGSHQNNPNLSRHSQVTHYFMGTPKCWRPGHSEKGRSYFTPAVLSSEKEFEPSSSVLDAILEPSEIGFLNRVKRSIKFRVKHYILKK